MVKVLGVKVPDRVYKEFKEICERERKTVSDVLYENVDDFLKFYKQFRKCEGEDARMFEE